MEKNNPNQTDIKVLQLYAITILGTHDFEKITGNMSPDEIQNIKSRFMDTLPDDEKFDLLKQELINEKSYFSEQENISFTGNKLTYTKRGKTVNYPNDLDGEHMTKDIIKNFIETSRIETKQRTMQEYIDQTKAVN
jgi:hypothetical protein